VFVSAVRVVSAPKLVGVHARGGGKRLRALSWDAVRHVDDGGGSGKRTLGNGEREVGLLYIWKNGPRNLFEFFCHFITTR